MAANFKWESLADLSGKWHLHVECQCRHTGTLDSTKLARWFRCHGWDMARAQIARHLKCGACKRRGRHGGFWLGISAGLPTNDPFPKTDADWATLVRDLRNR
ncbi:hypothetical protein [Sphingomonas koreensis]